MARGPKSTAGMAPIFEARTDPQPPEAKHRLETRDPCTGRDSFNHCCRSKQSSRRQGPNCLSVHAHRPPNIRWRQLWGPGRQR